MPRPKTSTSFEKRVTVYLLRPKDRPTFQLQWVDPVTGRRKTKSAGTDDPERAEQARIDLEYEVNHDMVREPSKMLWASFREQYEAEKLASLRPRTREKAGDVFDSFEAFIGDRKKLGDIDERTVSKYAAALRERGRKAATIHGHLDYLRAALRWAADQKLITAAPKVIKPKLSKKRTIRKIVMEELERLLAAAPDEPSRALISAAWYTGLRRNELLDLCWRGDEGRPWIDFDRNRVQIPAEYNKADADQWIPLHPELAAILEPLRQPHGRIFRISPSPAERPRDDGRLARKAGLKITLHDLRRSFGSRYAAVVPAQVLQRLMRHANIKTTLEYYTDLDDVLDGAILKA
jgi:integrase